MKNAAINSSSLPHTLAGMETKESVEAPCREILEKLAERFSAGFKVQAKSASVISIAWSDGPAMSEVWDVVAPYQVVHGGSAEYVLVLREYSDAAVRKAIATVAESNGLPRDILRVEDYRAGRGVFVMLADGSSLQAAVFKFLESKS